MKIGWVVPGFSANEQDWCIPALLNSARKIAESAELHIFTLRYPHQRQNYEVYGAKVHALGWKQAQGLRRALMVADTVKAIHKEAQGSKFDILHAFWADEPALAAQLAARLLKIPLIVSVMGGEFAALPQIDYGAQLSRTMHTMIQQNLRFADVVTVGSAWLCERSPLAIPLEIIPLGVDTRLFFPNDAPSIALQGDFRLLHVASMSRVKNQQLLLDTFALVQQEMPNAHLHWVGGGELYPQMTAYAYYLGVQEQVTFHGDVAHDALPDYYHAADLCLLTSHYESQSMVALEAAACGKLTVGTRVGILPQLVEETYLAEDAPTLAGKIIALANHPVELQQLAQIAYERTLSQFTLVEQISGWQKLYEELAKV